MSLGQNPSQTWNWQQAMDSHSHPHPHPHPHHYYHQQHSIREQMFEKPLTPSDVGKLNRLVIPKQHAERYFPLDSESGEKGLLLSFEDEVGKSWKFRYSYWTSSQSYVLTKGWSRFVKEKMLDAGDAVLFERSGDRLFIGCRRRSTFFASSAAATATSSPYLCMSSAGSVGEQAGSSPVAGSSRRMLRLFGVNLDCGPEPQNLVSGSWSQL